MFGLKPSNRPPKLAERILSRIVPDEWQTPLGDFEESYHALASEKGTVKAWLWYWGQIFILIPGKIKNSCYWMTIMLKNHLTIALRNILKHKGYSFIRICGLAVGMAAFILVMLYVQHESDFDTFNENYERIYRVEQIKKNKDSQTRVTKTPLSLAQNLRDKYPEIVRTSRVLKVNGHLYYGKKHRYLEEDGLMADPPVFEIFTFSFLEGDMETALKEPFSIVLTEELAKKYFGNKDPIGKFITFEKQYDCKVTGVIKNPPFQSHFKSRFIISLSSAKEMYGIKPDDEAQNRVFTYVLLPGNHNYQQVQEKIHDFPNKRSRGMELRLLLNPLSNLYFDTEASITIGPTNSRILVYIFLIIGFFTLLVAMINYINLSAADSTTRAKEVGIRKAIGGLAGP
jgi:putative ABC transport system permease protein